MTEPVQLEGFALYDISAEQWRKYVWPNGASTTIVNPEWLYVKREQPADLVGGGSHRVIDVAGVAHYIPQGWVHLTWDNKPDMARIQF